MTQYTNLGMYQGKNTVAQAVGNINISEKWPDRYLAQPCTETRKWTAYEIEYNLSPKRKVNKVQNDAMKWYYLNFVMK